MALVSWEVLCRLVKQGARGVVPSNYEPRIFDKVDGRLMNQEKDIIMEVLKELWPADGLGEVSDSGKRGI